MLLSTQVRSERLLSKGMARTAWSRMLNFSFRGEVKKYGPLIVPLTNLIRYLLVSEWDKIGHDVDESWLVYLLIEFTRWAPPVTFVLPFLLVLWLRWDEDCHLKDD